MKELEQKLKERGHSNPCSASSKIVKFANDALFELNPLLDPQMVTAVEQGVQVYFDTLNTILQQQKSFNKTPEEMKRTMSELGERRQLANQLLAAVKRGEPRDVKRAALDWKRYIRREFPDRRNQRVFGRALFNPIMFHVNNLSPAYARFLNTLGL